MKSARILKPNEPLSFEEIETPKPQGEQILVRVSAAGVCHSDLHLWEGGYHGPQGTFMKAEDRGVKFPLIPGHEVAGKIESLGKDAHGFKRGDSVLVYPWVGEGSCPACKAGDENLCDKPKSLGVYQNGGYAEYIIVPSAKYLVKLNKLKESEAAPLACSGLTAYTAIKNSGAADGELLVIIGAGGLGMMAIQISKALAKPRVVVIDIDDKRLDEARKLGADFVVNSTKEDAVTAVKGLSEGLGADAVIDFVNSSKTSLSGISMLRRRGRLVLVGLFGGELQLNLALIPLRAFKIIGSYTGNYRDLVELVALAEKGAFKNVVSQTFKLNEANKALSELKGGRVLGRAIISP
ncbi:MAG: alcohol dehydrogenase catalytic domain-containing protein [Candidatus Aenigmarchaeota archaeon]|nr:alcohol dehydrogenase catalytic domain-containing protein [Candidatus Aenigmarchaeota archaeon]